MSRLKKYFEENRNIFDDQELLEGHFERFEKRLDNFVAGKKRKQTLKIRFITAFSIAASILLVVATGLWLNTSSPNNDAPTSVVSEFSETEAFYREQMNEQIDAILCKLDKADDETRSQLEKDLQNITDDNNKFIAEIKENKNEELAIYYLVEHYNVNLQTLQFINDKLGEYFKC
jgi:phosphoglycerate-specific signal transduction histidine kinase